MNELRLPSPRHETLNPDFPRFLTRVKNMLPQVQMTINDAT